MKGFADKPKREKTAPEPVPRPKTSHGERLAEETSRKGPLKKAKQADAQLLLSEQGWRVRGRKGKPKHIHGKVKQSVPTCFLRWPGIWSVVPIKGDRQNQEIDLA
jgi:hypothetical protein